MAQTIVNGVRLTGMPRYLHLDASGLRGVISRLRKNRKDLLKLVNNRSVHQEGRIKALEHTDRSIYQANKILEIKLRIEKHVQN